MHQKPTKTCITSAEFGRLYSDYNPRFTEVAYRYVRDRGIAEDLVSDSFMAFWEERDRLPEDVNAEHRLHPRQFRDAAGAENT